jgi:Flp pilus assembly protein CpaB
MRRGRILILLAFVLIFGALAVYLLLGRSGDTGGESTGETPDAGTAPQGMIVMAAQGIERGTVIAIDDVVLTSFPVDLLAETMITDLQLVVGRIARMDIDRGIPITSTMVTDQAGDLAGVGSEASLAIPPGYTAIAIPMSRLSGVAYALRAGDSVDVLISMLVLNLDDRFQTALPNLAGVLISSGSALGTPPVYLTASNNLDTTEYGRVEVEPTTGQLVYLMPQGTQRPRLVTQRLIENATVLHVGTFPLESAAQPQEVQGVGAPADQTAQASTGNQAPDIVTLIVTPQDALALNWAIKVRADLMFTLRSPGDDTLIETTSVTLQYLLENYRIAVPTSLPYGLEPPVTLPTNPTLGNDATQE